MIKKLLLVFILSIYGTIKSSDEDIEELTKYKNQTENLQFDKGDSVTQIADQVYIYGNQIKLIYEGLPDDTIVPENFSKVFCESNETVKKKLSEVISKSRENFEINKTPLGLNTKIYQNKSGLAWPSTSENMKKCLADKDNYKYHFIALFLFSTRTMIINQDITMNEWDEVYDAYLLGFDKCYLPKEKEDDRKIPDEKKPNAKEEKKWSTIQKIFIGLGILGSVFAVLYLTKDFRNKPFIL